MCGQLSQENRRARVQLDDLSSHFGRHDLSGKRVYLWGGEPLLHPQLADIVRLFKHQGALVALNTNGFQLARSLESLVDAGLDRLILSIDGLDAATHDAVRGVAGSYDRLMNAIAAYRAIPVTEHSLRLRINFVVLAVNYRQIVQMAEWCRANGVYRAHFQLPIFLTEHQLRSYASLVEEKCSCSVRNYRGFLLPQQDIDYTELARTMSVINSDWHPFARFHPFAELTATDLETYFTSDRPVRECRCDVLEDRVAIDASGRFVACPDFPDLSYGTLSAGITNPSLLRWLGARFAHNNPLPICTRCCHFVPAEQLQ
jgi:sulfatase maturation enzyme AslB (radical SAM superfamily)